MKVSRINFDTERFTDLGKLNLFMVVRFYAHANLHYTAPAASKNDAQFKSCHNRPKNNQLASLV